MQLRRRSFLLLGALGVTACGTDPVEPSPAASESPSADPNQLRIGISMPSEISERWLRDGKALSEQLTTAGAVVDLRYGESDIPTQSQQITQMIEDGAQVLIISPVDGAALAPQLKAAADNDIRVISYDRLLLDSEAVDYYIAFDAEQVGVEQANSLLQGMGGASVEQPRKIEIFAGSPDDFNAHLCFQGAMSILEPLIEIGAIVVPSDQLTLAECATLRWDPAEAETRMTDLLAQLGKNEQLDGVLSPFDGISRAVISVLQDADAGKLPIVTGQDAEIESAKLIQDGVQYSTVFKDTRLLAQHAAIAALALADEREPQTTNTTDYDNGAVVVPSYLLDVQTVTKENLTEVLVDSGYWTQEQVDAGTA